MEPKPSYGAAEQQARDQARERRAVMQKRVETARAGGSEDQRDTAKIQGERWETTLLKLQKRTSDDPELINVMNDFLSAFANSAAYGVSDEPLNKERQRLMEEFFKDAAKRLQMLGR